jgi:recombination protein RecA
VSDTAALQRKINKKYGAGTLIRGTQLKDVRIPRTTSGFLSLDVTLGGGWPLNQWNEIVGQPSQGKTVLATRAIVANQQKNPDHTTLWIASEDFVPDWEEKQGMDLDRVMVLNTNEMELAFNAVDEALQERMVDAIVIDSYPALFPTGEFDQGGKERLIGDVRPGLAATMMGQMFRKTGASKSRSLVEDDRDCLLLMINQWREKIGVLHGDPRTTPGGKAKDFAFFTRVDVSKTDWIKGEDGNFVGQTIKVKNLKNKTAPPGRIASFDFYFDDVPGISAGSYDHIKEMFYIGVAYDVFEQDGNKYLYKGTPLYTGPHPSKDKAANALREDLDLQEDVRKEVLKVALHQS